VNQSIKKVKDTISRYGMIRFGDRVVVAVSGGADSVCLLDMLHELGVEILVAHFDHGLRPDDDEAETRFVKSLAASLDLPFETKKASPSMLTGAGPLEERARNARYRFLEEVKEKFSAQKIAVGHNLNDQAETVFMRLLRGSGTSGLAGIPPVRDGNIIRPLIEISREEILTYIEQRGIKYLTDPSNFETRFLRNRIRLELLPNLKQIQPRIIELLGQTSEIMRKDDAWMEAESEKWVKRHVRTVSDNEVSVVLSSFTQLPEALRSRAIRHVLRMTGGTLRKISMRHIESINRLITADNPQAHINLPNDLIVKRIYDRLFFNKGKGRVLKDFSYTLEGLGLFDLKELACSVSLEEIEATDLPGRHTSQWTAFLNADLITYPVMIRNFRPGDRFIPFGMSGHKKLKDFFIDLRIPAEDRARIPILTHNDRPVWVCGFRIDDRYKVTSEVNRILKVTALKKR